MGFFPFKKIHKIFFSLSLSCPLYTLYTLYAMRFVLVILIHFFFMLYFPISPNIYIFIYKKICPLVNDLTLQLSLSHSLDCLFRCSSSSYSSLHKQFFFCLLFSLSSYYIHSCKYARPKKMHNIGRSSSSYQHTLASHTIISFFSSYFFVDCDDVGDQLKEAKVYADALGMCV